MYDGALPCNALKVSSRILKSTRSATFNQCRSANAGEMWSRLRIPHTTLAAEFWTSWSFLMSFFGSPDKRELQLSSLVNH